MLSKYGVARHIYVPVVKRAVVDFAISTDWTPAAGDVKISKDGGAFANVTNLPVAINSANTGAVWDFSLTATEMQAAQVMVVISDASTKAIEDQAFIIETYGNASGQHALDLGTATVNPGAGGITTASFGAGAINAAAINADTGLIIRAGTAQAGAAGTITLDAGASATNNFYNGASIVITGGTGAGQHRVCSGYTGASKVANVSENWITNPDNTSKFAVIPSRSQTDRLLAGVIAAASIAADTGFIMRTGTAQAGGGSTITFDAGASAIDSFYNGAVVVITGGTGVAQHRVISGYVGATKVATLATAWLTNPDNTSTFAVLPAMTRGEVFKPGSIVPGVLATDAIDATVLANSAATEIRDAVWAQVMAELGAVPGVTGTALQALEWVFLQMRNKITQTTTTTSLYKDDGATLLAQAGVSDDGVTMTRSEFA